MGGMRATCSLFVLALTALAFLPGCGGEAHDATSKELSALTAEISKLRAEQAAIAERLEALEHGKDHAPAAAQAPAESAPKDAVVPPAPPAARTLDDDRPSLDVVRLGPSADDDDADTDAAGPRTVLRSGSNGIVVEEQTASGTTRTVTADPSSKKAAPAAKKSDKADRKKTASLPTP